MPISRIPCFCVAFAVAACRDGAATNSAKVTTAAVAAPLTVSPPSKPGLQPNAPVLQSLAPKYPGLLLAWIEPTPCDSVEIERADGDHAYPSQGHPPTPPLGRVPGGTKQFLDLGPTESKQFVYHARCDVAGTLSDWSNELAANPIR